MTALPRLLQLADTAFPTGAFAHSLGLEGAHAAGELRDEHDLERLLRRQLEGLATSDLVAVRAAHGLTGEAALVTEATGRETNVGPVRADEGPVPARGGLDLPAPPWLAPLIVLDHELDATRATRETREATRATGERFLIAAVALLGDRRLRALHDAVAAGTTPGTLPVAWGVATRAAGITVEAAVEAAASAALAALAAAGQRLVPLGGVATQRALWRAGEAINAAIARSAAIDPAELCSFVPELDVRSAQHERQRVRLFIS